ncbi:MAG: translation initiation factor IF-1 [Microgenomates group bacterium Gr01-1014_16]|nr:MAG: translation initiation factor IF-1 [Microgenomates group bacterium Gr01-1014_16]
MSNSSVFEASGIVVENLPNTIFRVKITQAPQTEIVDKLVLCTLSGKMRINWVRLLPGDKVKCDISSIDPTKGRITYKIK